MWRSTPGYVRLAYVVGAVLIVVGLVHAGIWLVVGGSAAGPLSWRKPTTFGISFGLATLTLGFVATRLRLPRGPAWIGSIVLCVAMTYEVAWAALQHARGVPSHFNDQTALDKGLFHVGAYAIAAAILVMLALTVLSFVRAHTSAPMTLAIRAGLLGLLVAQATGMWMIVHGNAAQDAGASVMSESLTTYGAAGVMKYAHAVPMHAIQVFCVLGWLLERTRWSRRTQVVLVACAVVAYAGVIGFAIVRTAMGLPPF